MRHQSGTGEQDERQGDLAHHQDTTKAVLAASRRRAAGRLLERLEKSRPAGLTGRCDPEHQAREKRQDQAEAEDGAIQPDLVEARQGRWHERQQDIGQPGRQKQPKPAPAKRQERALGEDLTQHPHPAGAQGPADGDLLLARRGPGQEKIGHVGAGDQEDEADRRGQDDERRAEGPDHLVLERLHGHAAAGVGLRKLLLERPGDRVHVGPGGFDGGPFAQAADDVDARVFVPVLHPVCVEPERQEHVGLWVIHAEGGRQDADDHDAAAVERQRTADEPRVAPEPRLPQPIGDDRDRLGSGSIVLRREIAPEAGRRSEC